jgi:hypothetical protein
MAQRTKYAPEEVERGLFALAICGDGTAASRQLSAQGQKIPARTLNHWKVAHAERFQEIANQHTRKIREKIAQEQIEIAHAAGEAERLAIAKTREQLEAGDVKDASTAGRNLGVQKGIALDQALKQRGEPTVVHEHRQAEEIVTAIKRLAPNVFCANGEAEEVSSAPQLPQEAA